MVKEQLMEEICTFLSQNAEPSIHATITISIIVNETTKDEEEIYKDD